MLQQILKDMYVDPELLAELDEEQKQVLFCKMREEQLRRWRERENQLELEEKKRPKVVTKTSKSKKRVDFMLGRDGQPWVWVMGDHEKDQSIDQILESEVQRQAQLQALAEAEKLAKQMEEELEKKRKEEEARVLAEKKAKEEELRKQAEEAMRQSQKESKALQEKLEEERKKEEERIHNRLSQIKARIDRQKRQSIAETNEMVMRRSMEIFALLQEQHKQKEKEAEEGVKKLTREWEEQERRAKEAEKQQQQLAKQVREKHNSLREVVTKMQGMQIFTGATTASTTTTTSGNTNAVSQSVAAASAGQKAGDMTNYSTASATVHTPSSATTASTTTVTSTAATASRAPDVVKDNKPPLPSKKADAKEAPPPKPPLGDLKAHPLKPPSKEAIVDWFRKAEATRGAGLEPGTKKVAPWFHGLITRQEAEQLLADCQPGTFLVRLSDRVWGYAVSYKGQQGGYKHYLIDAAGPQYHFFGDNQLPFNSLAELIAAYKELPISVDGQEKLLYARGQVSHVADYVDLFPGDSEVSHL